MKFLNDQILAQRTRAGDEQAFVALIRRYERSLAALIRDRLGSHDAGEDVLQETLVHAWSGLRVRGPNNVRAWLYQIARNRCSDYLRSTQRRERFVETETLAMMVNRFGVAEARQRRAVQDVVSAFELVPERESEALKSFYLEGLSIAEIAARHRCPPGTVKRRLSYGRDMVRSELGVTVTERSISMSTQSRKTRKRPFPKHRPEISITKLSEKPITLDLRELTWWFIVPEIDDEVRWANYEPPMDGCSPWRLSRTNEMIARRRAIIHGTEGVEIEIEQRELNRDGLLPYNSEPEDRDRDTKVWGRLTDTEVEWLGIERMKSDGTRELYTFLDEHFGWDFGSSARVVEDKSYMTKLADGTYKREADAPDVFSSGMFAVKIGEQEFECLRVFNIEKKSSEREVIVLGYITREGRTVLFRRYNGNRWGKRDKPPHAWGGRMTWEEDLPHTDRLVIDGVTYVHNYDSLTDLACGIRA